MLNDPLKEARDIAEEMNENLRMVIPAFVKRVSNDRGVAYRTYLKKLGKDLSVQIKKGTKSSELKPTTTYSVRLASLDRDAVERIIAGLIYERTDLPYKKAFIQARRYSRRKKIQVLKSLRTYRKNRHHKPPRALEEAHCAFDIVADWGVYKDLMRHRILTRHRQLFTNELGYILPQEIAASPFKKPYIHAMKRATDLYRRLKKTMPHEAQYAVTHGSYNRFYLKMNIREAAHFAELRSIPQGHPTYRKVAQDIAIRIGEKLPHVQKYLLPFVDYKDYGLERLSAFKKIAAKAEKASVRGFEE